MEVFYSAQALTKAQVSAEIAKLSFAKNEAGQYTYNETTTLVRGIECIVKGTYNPCDTEKECLAFLRKMYMDQNPTKPLLQRQSSKK